jgi:hypothetical protein
VVGSFWIGSVLGQLVGGGTRSAILTAMVGALKHARRKQA